MRKSPNLIIPITNTSNVLPKPLPADYPDSVRMTKDRLVKALLKGIHQGEHK